MLALVFVFGDVGAAFVEPSEDVGAFFLALAGVPGLSTNLGDLRVARMLNDTVGIMEMQGRVGVAGHRPSFFV